MDGIIFEVLNGQLTNRWKMRFFKYDYKNKVFILTLFGASFLLFLAVILKKPIPFYFLSCGSLICVCVGLFVIKNMGLRIDKKQEFLYIHDDFFPKKLKIANIKYVEIEQIKKEKKGSLYGFLNEYYIPSTYMYNCEYVYNNGEVFNIHIFLKNGEKETVYFGWAYKEKRLSVIEKLHNDLKVFVKALNDACNKK